MLVSVMPSVVDRNPYGNWPITLPSGKRETNNQYEALMVEWILSYAWSIPVEIATVRAVTIRRNER